MADERDRLVAALRRKLADLDAQVVAFRRERADEFRRYAVDLLQPVSDAVVAEVAKVLENEAKTRHDYAALYPGFLEEDEEEQEEQEKEQKQEHLTNGDHIDSSRRFSMLSPPPSSHAQLPLRRAASPPPVLYHTSGVPKDGPRRPPPAQHAASYPSPSVPSHKREDDFRGVFTPPFLPLLDGSSSNYEPRRPNGIEPPSSAPPVVQSTPGTAAAATGSTGSSNVGEAAVDIPSPAPTPPPPNEPKLKSALRRPSTRFSRSPTPSPSPHDDHPHPTRHVRFSFDGQEVPPTASPPAVQHAEQDLSWLLHDHHRASGTSLDEALAIVNGHFDKDSRPPVLPREIARPFNNTTMANFAAAGADAPRSPVSFTSLSDSAAAGGLPAGDSEPREHGPGGQGWRGGGVTGEGNPAQQGNRGGGGAGDQSFPSPGAADESDAPNQANDTPHYRHHNHILDDDEDEDEEDPDLRPLARKVSSSERLRALSKMPLEDPSMWTVVNPQADNPAADDDAEDAEEAPSVDSLTRFSSSRNSNKNNLPNHTSSASPDDFARPSIEERDPEDEAGGDEEEDDATDDDEIITMRPSRKNSREEAAIASPTASRSASTATLRPAHDAANHHVRFAEAPVASEPSTTPAAAAAPVASPPAIMNGNAPPARSADKAKKKKQKAPKKPAVEVVTQDGGGPADDDAFFDFEHDDDVPGGETEDGGDLVGYSLTRTSHHQDPDLEGDDEAEDEEDDRDDDDVEQGDDLDDLPDADDDDDDADRDGPALNGERAAAKNKKASRKKTDDQLVAEEKAALGIGTDGLADDRKLVFNHRKMLGENHGGGGGGGVSSSSPSHTPSPPLAASVGSYRGRPIALFDVVRDRRVLQEAAALGDLQSFVGSIHDAPPGGGSYSYTGNDVDLRSPLAFSGTPRSLTERMALEDARAAAAAAASSPRRS